MDGGVGGDAGRAAFSYHRHQRGPDADRCGCIPVSYFFVSLLGSIFYRHVQCFCAPCHQVLVVPLPDVCWLKSWTTSKLSPGSYRFGKAAQLGANSSSGSFRLFAFRYCLYLVNAWPKLQIESFAKPRHAAQSDMEPRRYASYHVCVHGSMCTWNRFRTHVSRNNESRGVHQEH